MAGTPNPAQTPTSPVAEKQLKEAADSLMMYLRMFRVNNIDKVTNLIQGLSTSPPEESSGGGTETASPTGDPRVASEAAPLTTPGGATNNSGTVNSTKTKETETIDPALADSRTQPISVLTDSLPAAFRQNFAALGLSNSVLHVIMNESGKQSNFSTRGADIVAIFSNLIPTIELSKCVPYVRINFIQNVSEKNEGQMPFLSLESYLGVARSSNTSNTTPGYNAGNAIAYTPVRPLSTNIGTFQTGMELFLAPQTLLNTSINQSAAYRTNRGITALDPMQPLMSLESISIDVSAVSQNLMQTQQKIDLSLVLHDRSRLVEITPLVSPSAYPTMNVEIEWGWSHPDGNLFSPNPFAKFMNALRSKQIFSVVGSSISNKESSAANVKVQLISLGDQITRSASVTTGTAVNGTRYAPYGLVKAKLNQAARISESNKLNKSDNKTTNIQIVGPEATRIENPGWPTSDKWVKYDSYRSLAKAVSAAENDVSRAAAAIDEYRKILTEVAGLDDGTLPTSQNLSADLAKSLQTEIAEMTYEQSGYLQQFKGTKDKYLTLLVAEFQKETGLGNFTALGDLISRIYTFPLAASLIYDEIRVVTYDCNDSAGFMGGINIGCIPIPNTEMLGVTEGALVKPQMSIKSALQRAIRLVNSKSAIAYGFRETMNSAAKLQKDAAEAEDDDDATASAEAVAETRASIQQTFDKQLVQINDRRSKVISDAANLLEFVVPRIKVEEVSVPLKDGKLALHVFIYDEANSGYRSVNLITSILNSRSGFVTLMDTNGVPPDGKVKLEKITQEGKSATGKSRIMYNATINRKTAKDIVTYAYPTLRIGTGGTAIISATYSTSTAGDIANINILNGYRSQVNPSVEETGPAIAADMFVIPATVTLNMLGMPLINRGQAYYIDFGTGTTIDNVYVVTTVKHTIRAGQFNTTVTLNPIGSGTIRSVVSALQSDPPAHLKPE